MSCLLLSSRWRRQIAAARTAAALLAASLTAAGLAGCGLLPAAPRVTDSVSQALADFGAVPLVLIGEQHDADAHQQAHAQAVDLLAQAGRLAALALEMADAPQHTAALPRDADEARVRAALRWDDAGWPWRRYGPVVMAAVRAGVPVHGANLPRADLRAAMGDLSLDKRLAAAALDIQRSAVRDGHCGLLPESQIAPMTRMQVARDQRMAQTVAALLRQASAGQTVLLLAGTGHVRRDVGVPQLLRSEASAAVAARVLWLTASAPGTLPAPAAPALDRHDRIVRTPPLPARDYCAELRDSLRPRNQN